MLKILLPFICALTLCASVSFAQPYVIKGSVSDTVNNNPLQNASILLMHAKDSVMETFTRSKEDGSFELKARTKGKYILTTSFPGFADFIDRVEIKNDQPLNLGQLPMISRTHLMKEFVMTKEYAAIKVKGDTIEYVADSFMTNGNATVESLLKKLPGIQVDKDGKIIAQGETVEKLLVDGEEFFTDDPAVVSKSLQAKAVDKVQVFNKKSEQAEFTGIDDGETTKTINLQLKDNMKKGVFGKAVAAGGAGDQQNYFENQLMLNAFKGKRKIAIFGIMANTGKIGLGWEDRDKFGGGNGFSEITDGGYVTYYNGGMDEFESWDGQYNGQGFPRAWTGGAHYSNKWNEDKHHLGTNYRYAKQDIATVNNTLTENYLPNDVIQYTEETNDQYKVGYRHKADAMYEFKPDTSSLIRVNAMGNYSNMNTRTDYQYQTFSNGISDSRNPINNSTRTLTSDADTKRFTSSLMYRKKFKKKGRTIYASVNQSYDNTTSEGFLLSTNDFFSNGIVDSTALLDQQKLNENNSFSINSNVTYTEPLSKVMYLLINYGYNINNNEASRLTYNKTDQAINTYDSLVAPFSSSYAYDIGTHNVGLNFKFDYKNLDFGFGSSVAYATFTQTDRMVDTSYTYSFTNLFPTASLTYKFSKQTNLRFYYRGSTRQPSLQQVQPIQDNTDPLNISIGNPNLKQQFSNYLSLSFHDYKMLSGRYIWSSVSFNTTDNAITRTENINNQGIRTYQYQNIDGNYNGSGSFSMGKRINKLNMRVGGRVRASFNHNTTLVNGQQNITDYNTYTFGPEFSYSSKDDKLYIAFDPGITYNDNNATINTTTTSYWVSNNEFEFTWQLPLHFEVSSDINWAIRQQTSVFDQNNNVFLWNAYVGKKFLKNEQLELRASVFDILNQNRGFNRFAQNNYITQQNYNTIRRYGLISLIWNFTKTAAGAPDNSAEKIIMSR